MGGGGGEKSCVDEMQGFVWIHHALFQPLLRGTDDASFLARVPPRFSSIETETKGSREGVEGLEFSIMKLFLEHVRRFRNKRDAACEIRTHADVSPSDNRILQS